jgi:alcohol dehydrogenase/L-iditol 2-dehydrogenase
MNRAGALAEHLVVPGEFAWPISGRDATDLVCVEPLAVVEAALRRMGTPLPAAALVVAVGPQGLLMCLALSRRGVLVFADDLNQERVAFAATIGASGLPVDEDGPRFDLVVDTGGTPASLERALSRAEIGGTLLGLGLDSRPFELSAQTLVRRQLVIRGSLTYDHPVDFRAAIDLVQAGHASPGQVVSSEFPLEEAQIAFESSGAAPGKTWIRVAPRSGSS